MTSCLGIVALGTCHYDPKQPYLTYFTLGDAVSALGFTLAVQQLVKPIYLFRLRAYGLRLIHLLVPVFIGFMCTLVATLIPNLPFFGDGPLAYPLLWEMLGAISIGSAYGIALVITLGRPNLTRQNLISFVRAASTLLSSASDEDRISLAEDLLRKKNLSRLFTFAAAWERARHHEIQIEFDRLRSVGKELSIRGNPPPSAFYRFQHRKELEQASFAGTFLRILSDQDMCSALVRKAPWMVSDVLSNIAEVAIFEEQAKPFIQELAYQAIFQDESMMSKEISYSGFNAVPLMSNSLFSNWFIVGNFDPLNRIDFAMPEPITAGFIRRLNKASYMILEVAIEHGDFWPRGYIYAIQRHYESLCHKWSYARYKGENTDFAFNIHSGVEDLCRAMLKGQMTLVHTPPTMLYATDSKKYRGDLIGVLASIVFESLSCVANKFAGVNDEAWMHAISMFHQLFPFHDGRPKGMNPLQQQIAVLLIDKLKDNMGGWYPAISRVLIACIGPHDSKPVVNTRSAFVILKDAMYHELKKLKSLYERKPEKIGDFLPENVVFDPVANTLTHTYRGGSIVTTPLGDLDIPAVDLFDPVNWQTDEIFEP